MSLELKYLDTSKSKIKKKILTWLAQNCEIMLRSLVGKIFI